MKAVSLSQPSTTRWEPGQSPVQPSWPVPPLLTALGRGLRMCCPACGQTKLFRGYLKVEPVCGNCGTPLGRARADDAPPYFTIFIVGHLIIAAMWAVERAWAPPLWLHAAIWLPLTLVLTLLLLRPIKGAVLGAMLSSGMLKPGSNE